MQGATARTPRLIVSCTTGAAKSTSHVVNITSAPPLSSFTAQAFAIAALLPCVSHVLICSFRPLMPPFALRALTRNCAAARAGLSNGAIAPLPSYAQPITIGPAAGADVRAAAVVASATTAIRIPAKMSPIRVLGLVMCAPSFVEGGVGVGRHAGISPDESRACARTSSGGGAQESRVRRADGTVVRADSDLGDARRHT